MPSLATTAIILNVESFIKKLLIYIPAHNCADTIVGVIRGIPPEVSSIADIIVVDNSSSDGTQARLEEAREANLLPLGLTVMRTSSNLGYAGSQKLAYKLAVSSPSVEWVIMLHGDGQYPSGLTALFLPFLESPVSVCYGYRSKLKFREEETPWLTWLTIKVLSLLESCVTGVFRKEWHTGFVMYRTSFLRKVALDKLTQTPHIDGNLLFVSGAMGLKTAAVPIYKRYKELTPFEGAARREYVLDVLRLMFEFRRNKREYIG